MATYVISDIHGQYDMFIELLDKIKLKEKDTHEAHGNAQRYMYGWQP